MLYGKELMVYGRINEAITKFNKFNFTYSLKNYRIGYFMVWNRDEKAYQYIAELESILGIKEKGINDLIRILRGEL